MIFLSPYIFCAAILTSSAFWNPWILPITVRSGYSS